ncbi:MAG: PH domain-containing protein [Actinomycetota bacterium]|nr:PH domain-containing protein [Actinomycetota bacterium]
MTSLRPPAHRVHPRARLMWQLAAGTEVLVLAVVLVATGVVADLYDLRWWMPVLLAAYAVVRVVVVPIWRFRVHRWEVTPQAAYTQTGWWARERRLAPMSRIQTVDWDQGPLERLLGLANVTITTASAAGALSIGGLDQATAESLVAELTAKAEAAGGDAT